MTTPTIEKLIHLANNIRYAEHNDEPVQPRIDALEAALRTALAAHEAQYEPVATVLPQCLAQADEPWCRDVLLYSPNNKGDSPHYRVTLYARKETP